MKSKRLSLTITPQVDKMLVELLATGLWGRSKAEVAQRLLYQQLQIKVGGFWVSGLDEDSTTEDAARARRGCK